MKLTKRMRDVLKHADVQTGEINNVSMAIMYGLESRELVPSDWRKAAEGGAIQRTGGWGFPTYRQVKLTAAGIRAARSIQGFQM
jgi:hypothetical protein